MLKTYLTTFILGCLLFVGACGEKPAGYEVVPVPKYDVTTSERTMQTTPMGARVASENGVPESKLAQADAGLTQAFNDGRASGWEDNGRAYNYAAYIIYVPVEPCVPSPGSHIPSFLVRADNYDGSIYDHYNSKGYLPTAQQTSFMKFIPDGKGVVYASEMVRSFNAPDSVYNGQLSNYSRMVNCLDDMVWQNVADYGAEHNIAMNLDRAYYFFTQTHSVIGHPILPKRSAREMTNYDYYKPTEEVKLPIVGAVK